MEDRRREAREQLLGDISWAYASDGDERRREGTFVDESASGLSMLTLEAVKEGSMLKLRCDGRWATDLSATVQWCREISPNVYRCGLIRNEEK